MMKKLIIFLVSILTFGAGAQEAPGDKAMKSCVNDRFVQKSYQVVSSLLKNQIAQARSEGANRGQVEAYIQPRLIKMIAPFINQTKDENGNLLIEVIDEDIITAYTPLCNSLLEQGFYAASAFDEDNASYKLLNKGRSAIQSKIQEKLDLIEEYKNKIAELEKEISPDLADIERITADIEKIALIPSKSREEMVEALRSPEVIALAGDLDVLLEEKFSESIGMEVNIGANRKLALSGESEPQPESKKPVAEDEAAEEWVPEFRD